MPNTDFTVRNARLRAGILHKIRSFFKERDILEIETPLLSRGVSTDCHLDVFSSKFHPDGYTESNKSTTLYLQTSPELLMKRLLSEGFPDIYQICKVFRNGEQGKIHNPEFSMLEWYRLNFGMHDLISETADLFQLVLGQKTITKATYQEFFIQCTGLDPLESTSEELLSLCGKVGKEPPPCPSKSDILNFMMSEIVEPEMPDDTLLFIHNFPAEQAVLARLDPQDKRTAFRFECYFEGVELCNGFEELNDPEENRRRMTEENTKRLQAGKPALPVDDRFIESLASLPPCSGNAAGLDRLVMLASGSKELKETVSFPFDYC